jgi:hypothetical protein
LCGISRVLIDESFGIRSLGCLDSGMVGEFAATGV